MLLESRKQEDNFQLGENNERLIEATDQYYSNNEDLYQIADFL